MLFKIFKSLKITLQISVYLEGRYSLTIKMILLDNEKVNMF